MTPELQQALQSVIIDDGISCRQAHAIAVELNLEPKAVGKAIDMLNCRLNRCQMGLFGYRPVKKIVQAQRPSDLHVRQSIESAARGKKIPCITAWELARQLKLDRRQMADFCEHLGIKIIECQLGAF